MSLDDGVIRFDNTGEIATGASQQQGDLSLYFSCDDQRGLRARGKPDDEEVAGAFAGRGGATFTRSTAACSRGGERGGSDWTQFLRIVDFLAGMSDATGGGKCRSAPTNVPSLGDLIFSVAQLLVLPNALEGYPSSCSSKATGTRPGAVGLDNHIVRDLFVLSVRQFTELYLEELVQSCDAAQRAMIFQVKTWLTCRLHFDHQLVDSLTDMVHTERGARPVTQSEARQLVVKSISNATNGRLVFRDSPNRGSATLARIESFSPTFALFTLCNMRDEYVATAYTHRRRFDRDDAESNVGQPPSVSDCIALYGARAPSFDVPVDGNGGGNRAKSILRNCKIHSGSTGTVFRPMNRAPGQMFVTTNVGMDGGKSSGATSLWPEQKLLVNARGLVNRDRTLQRFVNVACVEKSLSLSHDSTKPPHSGTMCTTSSSTVIAASSTSLAGKSVTTNCGVSGGSGGAKNNDNNSSIPGVTDAIKMFDRSDYYESRFRSDRSVVPLARGFDAYRRLLQRLTLAWAKLNFLEPNIFT